jgi:hypothetical protein
VKRGESGSKKKPRIKPDPTAGGYVGKTGLVGGKPRKPPKVKRSVATKVVDAMVNYDPRTGPAYAPKKQRRQKKK